MFLQSCGAQQRCPWRAQSQQAKSNATSLKFYIWTTIKTLLDYSKSDYLFAIEYYLNILYLNFS